MKIAILAAALAGAAVALAPTASADPLAGDYTGTMLDGGNEYQEGGKAPFTLNTCGPDCIHLTETGSGWELHRQGGRWVGTSAEGTQTLDEGTLVLTINSVGGGHIVIGLVKNA